MSSTLYTLPGRPAAPVNRRERLFAWTTAHRAQLGLAALVLAIAVVLTGLIVYNRRQMAERGAEQLSAARYQASQDKPREALRILDEVLRAHRSDAVAMQAYLLKGEVLTVEDKWGEAATVYAEGHRQASRPEYRALLLLGRAAAAVELEKWVEARDLYADFLKEFPGHHLVPRALLETARLALAMNEPDKAGDPLDQLSTLYPQSHWAMEGEALRAEAAALSSTDMEKSAAPR